MNVTDWLIAFIPALSFGLVPVVGTFIGGKPVQQTMGISLGAFVFALIVVLIRKPELNTHIFLISFISGILWAIGSIGQFKGITYLGVARATPIMNGGQIIGTSLVGIALGDWASSQAKIYGFIALVLIIIGIILTSYQEKSGEENIQWKKGILINLIGVLGFTFYVGIIKYFKIDGWSSILPQSIGQIVATFLFGWLIFKTKTLTTVSLKNGIVGIIWACGNLALLISQSKLGLATAYPIGQAAVIISVFGGVYINKEQKTTKEWKYSLSGIIIICLGLFMIYQAGNN